MPALSIVAKAVLGRAGGGGGGLLGWREGAVSENEDHPPWSWPQQSRKQVAKCPNILRTTDG